MTGPASLVVTGSLELQLDTLAERVARRVVELLATDTDPHAGTGRAWQGVRDNLGDDTSVQPTRPNRDYLSVGDQS